MALSVISLIEGASIVYAMFLHTDKWQNKGTWHHTVNWFDNMFDHH